MPTFRHRRTHAIESSSRAWQERILSVLLQTFSASFREHYGADLKRCVYESRGGLGDLPLVRAIGFWVATFVDIGSQGIRERIAGFQEAWTSDTSGGARAVPETLLRRGVGGFLILAAASNVTYDALSAPNSMGIFAVLLTAVGAISGFLLVRPRGPRRRC